MIELRKSGVVMKQHLFGNAASAVLAATILAAPALEARAQEGDAEK